MWAALASAGDHLLAVNASPARLGRRRGNGGRGIKERVCLHPRRGGGGGTGAHPPPEPRDPSAGRRGSPTTMAGSATRLCPLGFAESPSCLHSRRWLESRGAESKKTGPADPPSDRRTATPTSTWSCTGQVPGAPPAASSRGAAGPAGSLGARRSAVLSSPQSLGNHNGVSISVRTSPAPATQITDNFHTSHLTFWSAARRQDRLGEAFHIKL